MRRISTLAAASPTAAADTAAAASPTSAAPQPQAPQQQQQQQQQRYERLLSWATDETPRVAVRDRGGGDRGLVATQDVAPGGVLLSVPMHRVFKSRPYDQLEMHWAAEMGMRLLQERAACDRRRQQGAPDGSRSTPGSSSSSSSSSTPSSTTPSSNWCAWIECLPERVVTPLSFTPAQVRACGLPSTAAEVSAVRAAIAGCAEELRGDLEAAGCDEGDLFWAVQALTSRCFFDAGLGLHLSVPGVDMANDAGDAANARVRTVHSPDACQGAAALEDVAEARPAPGLGGSGGGSGGASLFQLVAGDDGVAAGEEVCISYGASWPAEPYFLLFGFVPEAVAADSVVVYQDVDELAHHYCSMLPRQKEQVQEKEESGLPLWQRVAARAAEAAEESGLGACERLVVAGDGLDGRLAPAIELVRAAAAAEAAAGDLGGGGSKEGLLTVPAVVVDRLQQLRAMLDEAEAHQRAETDGATAAAEAEAEAAGWDLVARYRAAKLRVIESALAAMGAGGGGGGGGGGRR